MDLDIDFIILAKSTSQILADMKGLAKIKGCSKAATSKGENIMGFPGLVPSQAACMD